MWVWPAIAIVVILLAVRVAGARGIRRFSAADEVRGLLAVEQPELSPREIDLSTDGRTALVDTGVDDAVAVAFVMGNQVATRELRRGDIAAVEEHPAAGAHEVTIRTHDLGFPRVQLLLDPASWTKWQPRLRGLVGVMFVGLVGTASAQEHGCGTIELEPATPVPGAFFKVRVPSPAGSDLRGEAFGQPLHFEAGPSGVMVALAGAAIDSTGGAVRISCQVNNTGATSTARVALGPARYPTERLRVDPRFVDAPDSALAARTAREAARAAAVARASHDTPTLWRGAFHRPRPSRVTSGYGRARVFNGQVQSRHLGTDFAGAVGAPVRSANRGIVRIVDAFYYGGRVVYVDHGGGITTAYLHLSRHRVAEGDTVVRGQVIGEVGASGRVTGPHLHFIARYGGLNLDPLSLLRVTAPPTRTP